MSLFVVACVELHEHGVRTCGEVAFHYLGYAQQTLHDVLVHAAAFEIETYVCACGVADALRIDVETASGDHSVFHKMLHALVYRGS